jgi:hypothetical protein
MGLLSNFLIFLTMAFRTRHQVPGSITTTAKVKVKEPIVNNTTKTVDIEQPANSVVDAVFIHVVDDIVLDATVDVQFKLGTASDDDAFVVGTIILDGSDGTNANKVAANTVFKCALASGSDYATPGASGDPFPATLVTENRTLKAKIISGAGDAVDGSHGDIDIHVQFRQF